MRYVVAFVVAVEEEDLISISISRKCSLVWMWEESVLISPSMFCSPPQNPSTYCIWAEAAPSPDDPRAIRRSPDDYAGERPRRAPPNARNGYATSLGVALQLERHSDISISQTCSSDISASGT